MELLVVVGVLLLFDLAALRWGRDSRGTARGDAGTGGILPQAEPDHATSPRVQARRVGQS